MENVGLSSLIAARAGALAYYSPYYFLRQLAAKRQQDLFGTGAAARWGQGAGEIAWRCHSTAATAAVH